MKELLEKINAKVINAGGAAQCATNGPIPVSIPRID